MKKILKLSMLSLGVMASGATFAAGVCSVSYKTSNNWGTGGQEDIVLTNTGASVSGWELCWAFNGNEAITNLWNGTYTASGKNICVKNVPYNADLAANASVAFGFTHNNAPGAIPTQFTLNGASCGGVATSSTPTTSSSAPSSAASAILIQAESYAMMQGVQTEGTSDTGGGMNVGYIDAGDWLSYPEVDLPCGGNYTVEYRVASQSTGGQLTLEKAGGSPVFGSLNFTATGGWQTWKTVSHSVTLPAGKLALGLAIPQGGWNLNWIRLIPNCGVVGSSSVPSSTPTTSSKVSSSTFTTSTPTTSSRVSSSVPSSTPTTSTPTTSSRASSSAPTTGARWLLDGTNSTFHFVSTKKIDIEENFTFTQLQGTVGADGKAVLTIPLASLATGVDIRNTRMQSMLFESNYLPSMHFSAQLDLAAIEALPVGGISTLSVAGNLTLHGVTKAITFDALIVKNAANNVSFSPRKPIIIDSVDFDLNTGIEALRVIGSLTAIAEKVPVYFKMYLTKDNPTNIPAITLPAAPNAPLSLAATVSNATGNANLTWADVSSGETGFLVRRRGADGRWATVNSTPANSVSYVDSLTAIGSGSFDYKVISFVDSVPSLPTTPATVVYNNGTSSVPSSSAASVSSAAADGKTLYTQQCASCHNIANTAFPADKNLATLTVYIRDKMPIQDPTLCGQECASAVASYLLNRNNPSSGAVSSSAVSVVPSSKSSSSVIVVPSSSAVSSSAPFMGDAAVGRTLFRETSDCKGCHKDENEDGFVKDGIIQFNVNQFTYQSLAKYSTKGYTGKSVEDLSRFLADNMSPSTHCVGVNCQHMAAYLWSLRGQVEQTNGTACTSTDPVFYGQRTLKLLTSFEYRNSLQALFTKPLAADYGSRDLANPDTMIANLPNHNKEVVSEGRLASYNKNAQDIAAWAITNNALPFTCSTAQSTACATSFIDNFAYLAFRRPLTTDEKTDYTAIIMNSPKGLQWAVQSVLMAPQFLYRSEIGIPVSQARAQTWGKSATFTAADGTAYALDPFEFASALAYMYTSSAPDKTLLTAAAAGDLEDPTKLNTQIDRLLDSALGREAIGRFAGLWFRTDAVTEANRFYHTGFTAQVKSSMAQEIREIYKYVFYNNLPYTDLYTGNFTMLNSTLSQYYGLSGGGVSDTDWRMVNTETTGRGGVLASGAFMTMNAHEGLTSPIKRSVHFRQDMLCQNIPLPPTFGDSAEREAAAQRAHQRVLAGDATTTEFYELQTNATGTACADCHRAIINPLYSMDTFDNAGLLRSVVNGKVVQTALDADNNENGAMKNVPIPMVNNGGAIYGAHAVGVVNFTEVNAEKDRGQPGIQFTGAKGLAKAIVAENLPGVSACLIQKSFRYATGYSLYRGLQDDNLEKPLTATQQSHYACVAKQLNDSMSAGGGSPRAMLKKLGTSNVVRFRR